MWDMDCGSDEGLDVGTDFDISEETEYSSDLDLIDEDSSFETLEDINDSSEDYSEVTDSFSDMEIEYSEELPTLEEYSDLIDEADDVEELSEIKVALISGVLSGKELEREYSGIYEYDEETTEDLTLLEDIEPELTFTQEELYELSTEHADELEIGSRIEELKEFGRIAIVESGELENSKEDGDDVKALTREITPEMIESREHDTEEILDNYRENLRERGVPDEQIREFISQERDKMNAEYESLEQGNLSENIYYEPTDWDVAVETIVEHNEHEIAEHLTNEAELDEKILENLLINEIAEVVDEVQENNLSISDLLDISSDIDEEEEVEEGLVGLENTETEDFEIEENISLDAAEELVNIEVSEEVEETTEILVEELENQEVLSGDNVEGIVNETQELNINYDDIYAEIDQVALEQGFENINIYKDPERLDSSLEIFEPLNWENLSLERKKESISTLAEYVEDVIGFDNPPRIEYYNNRRVGDYGGYDSRTNTLSINEYMLYDSDEAADTIAHELWHAHQRECAENPQSARDYQYQYNFQNYIRPEMGHEAYENQLIEAEARGVAAQFKGRLTEIRGRSR